MGREIDRTALERTVAEKSSLSLAQIERMFGAVTEGNRRNVWRFLNLPSEDQRVVWDACLRLAWGAPDVLVIGLPG